jgi:hypothetical protein
MSNASHARWCLIAQAAPAARCWNDEWVIHHALANDTHRLTEPAGLILQHLVDVPPNGGLATLDLAERCGIHPDDAEDALQALAAVGFVAQC